jgi:hypothetical protein
MAQDRPSATVVLHGLLLCLRDEEIPVDEIDGSIEDIKEESHFRDFYRIYSDESIRVDPNAELPPPGLGNSGNTQQITDMLENLEAFFDNDHPVMRTLAHSIDEQSGP